MSSNEKIFNLKLHKVSRDEFNTAVKDDLIDKHGLYAVPEEELPSFSTINVNGKNIVSETAEDEFTFKAFKSDGPIKFNAVSSISVVINPIDGGTAGIVQLSNTGGTETGKAITPKAVDNAIEQFTSDIQDTLTTKLEALDYTYTSPGTVDEIDIDTPFIDSISQEQGKIAVTKKTIPIATDSTPGVTKLTNDNTNTSTELAIIPEVAKKAALLASHQTYYDTLCTMASVRGGNAVGIVPEGTTEVTSEIVNNIYENNITKVIVISNSVTSIGSSAFSNKSSLTSVVIPSSVTSIGAGAFYGCSGLTSMEIPDSITSISEYTFYNCNSLTSVVIPSSVTSIGYNAFGSCFSITSIKYRGTQDQWEAISKNDYWNGDIDYTITYNYTGN